MADISINSQIVIYDIIFITGILLISIINLITEKTQWEWLNI